MLASTADSAQFWRIGQNWLCYLAWPFHALFARILCNTFLESLKHTNQPWVVFVSWAWNFIKNGFSLLCCTFGPETFEPKKVQPKTLWSSFFLLFWINVSKRKTFEKEIGWNVFGRFPMSLAQCPEIDFNKVSNTIHKTYIGLTSMLQWFQKHIAWNSSK